MRGDAPFSRLVDRLFLTQRRHSPHETGLLAPPLQPIDRTFVRFRGRKLTYFGGCDYLRLSSHPALRRAARRALRLYGLNVAASRRTTGNHVLYEALEQELCAFFKAPAAVLVSSGYTTNLAVAQALAGRFTHALIDERAHACLFDAARFLEAPLQAFAHRDPADAGRTLRGCGPSARPLLLTDGMFSHDGSVAPLADYLRLLPARGWLLVDDAHAAGVLGPGGRGTAEHLKVSSTRLIQTITLSKAFGAYGGAILGPAWLRNAIIGKSRVFAGNTPPPLPVAAAALQALQLVKANPRWLRRLESNTRYAKSALRRAEVPLGDGPGPIIAVRPRHNRAAAALKRRLLAARIYPTLVKYPGGPPGGYFRFALSSEHTRAQLNDLIRVLAD